MTSLRAPAGAGWYWHWGAPAAACLGFLAAAGLAAAWLSSAEDRLGRFALSAAAFSATLLLSWVVAGPGHPSISASAAQSARDRAVHAVLATAVVSTAVVAAAYLLDGPLVLDEQKSIIDYGVQPLAAIAASYDDPNNHVLHTLLLRVAYRFGGTSLVVLRQPAFLSFCLLLPALWWFARQEYGPTAAVFATAFTGMSPMLVEYATVARGYTILLLLFMAALLCGRVLVRKPDSRALWATWAAAVALGFFTMPLMVLPALTAVAWMLLVRWREGGRAAVGPFAVKTAVWSVVALAGTGVLYAPIIAAEGIQGVHATLVVEGEYAVAASRSLLLHPFEVWDDWHFKHPSWAKGVLCALVVVGAAVPGRGSRPRVGVLLLATGLATALLMATRPFMLTPRLALWMAPLVMVAAGVGAASVLEGALDRAGARWPRVAAAPGRRIATCGAAALVAGVLAVWSVQPVRLLGWSPKARWRVHPMAFATAERMELGDHFATYSWVANFAVIRVRERLRIESDAGFYHPLGTPDERWSVHRVSARRGTSADPGGPSPDPAGPSPGPGRPRPDPGGPPPDPADPRRALEGPTEGRLFVMYPRDPDDADMSFASEFVDAHPSDHELIAAFDGGLVYMLKEWTKHPRRLR